jgi:hypothetical protein
MSGKTAEDRKHDFKVTFFAFVLTTLVGGSFTLYFQYREDQHKERAEAETAQAQRLAADRAAEAQLTELRRTGATQLFDDVSVLMDKRLFLWRRFAWSLEKGNESIIRADRATI